MEEESRRCRLWKRKAKLQKKGEYDKVKTKKQEETVKGVWERQSDGREGKINERLKKTE